MLRAKHRVGGIQCPAKLLLCVGVPSLIVKEHPETIQHATIRSPLAGLLSTSARALRRRASRGSTCRSRLCAASQELNTRMRVKIFCITYDSRTVIVPFGLAARRLFDPRFTIDVSAVQRIVITIPCDISDSCASFCRFVRWGQEISAVRYAFGVKPTSVRNTDVKWA